MNIKLRKVDVAKLTEVKSRTILDWTQRGYIVPAKKAIGQGKISYYSLANAVQVKVLSILFSLGFTPKLINTVFGKEFLDLGIFEPSCEWNSVTKEQEDLNGIFISIGIGIKKIKQDIAAKLKHYEPL